MTPEEADRFLTGGMSSQKAEQFLTGGGTVMEERIAWKSVFADAVSNSPESALKYGSDLFQAVRHPIQTADALLKTVGGYGEKAVRKYGSALLKDAPQGSHEWEQYADAFTEHMVQRYGTIDSFKNTLAKDPVGVLADISMVLVPATTTVKAIGTAGKLPTVAKTGATLQKTAAALEPINIAKRVVSYPAKLVPKGSLQKMYQSAVKFSTTLSEESRIKLSQAALDNQIMPTVDGLYKLKDQINELNREIATRIDSATNRAGANIPIDDLFQHLDSLKEQHSFLDDWRDIDRVQQSLAGAYQKLEKTHLTPKEAQKLKVEIYRKLEAHYTKSSKSPATVEAKMAISRASKELIQDIIPEIKNLNQNDGALIELYKALDRPVSRIQNHNLISMDAAIKTGLGASGGAAVAGAPGSAVGTSVGLALSILEHPKSKAAIAIFVNRLKKRGVKIRPSTALARLLAAKAGSTIDYTP
ncbi:MAG: hypothetical protein ACXABD_19570 [Candidatus Thorarchaeota archaeon]